MTSKSWLVTWVGQTDLEAANGKLAAGMGPVATALCAVPNKRFDRVHLLTNYGLDKTKAYREWLIQHTGYSPEQIELFDLTLDNPINYALIYTEVSQHLRQAGLPRKEVTLTFHLSPGTSAMTAIWIVLAKTRFPARLIQTSRERGLEPVDFAFDLATDFLPEYLQRGTQRIDRLANAAPARPEFAHIAHSSTEMRKQISAAQRVAGFDVPVLILGETGTGKELFAKAIHEASRRKGKPFVAVNCGALSPELASSELFGHEKGAFTGAIKPRPGLFRSAQGGTLFLDEIGDLPSDTQVRLLRVLQEKKVTPLGASHEEAVDVRIVAATHQDLVADVATRRFREDLFHRLAVGILRLPPLRERAGDLDVLIDRFLDDINKDPAGQPGAPHKVLTPAARQALHAHHWPGNVRELYHTLLRAAIWSPEPDVGVDDIRTALLPMRRAADGVMDRPLGNGFHLQTLLDEVSRHYLSKALAQTRHHQAQAAQLLGFNSGQNVRDWIKRLNIMDKQ